MTPTTRKSNKGIFVGEKLKKKLGLNIGDYLTIMSSQNYETIFGNLPRSANFKIVGFFNIGMYEYDTSLIFMPINLLQKFLDNNGRIDHYEIIVENFNDFIVRKRFVRHFVFYQIFDLKTDVALLNVTVASSTSDEEKHI